jgi:hypothetical protein
LFPSATSADSESSNENRHGGFLTVPSIFGGRGEGLPDDLIGFLPRSKKVEKPDRAPVWDGRSGA